MDFAFLSKTLSSNYSSNIQLNAYVYTHNVGMHGIIIVKELRFPLFFYIIQYAKN